MTIDQILKTMIKNTLQETEKEWDKTRKTLSVKELEAMAIYEMKQDCDFLSNLFCKGDFDETHYARRNQ